MPGLMPLKHNATYEDLCVVPDHMVAEILDGDLYASPRPALPHAQASSMLSSDIIYDGSLNRGGHYELKAHSGDVRLTIADGVGFELDAGSFSGNVRSHMPVTMKSFGSEVRRSRRTLRGSFGDGSAYLQLTTFSGDIVIAKR